MTLGQLTVAVKEATNEAPGKAGFSVTCEGGGPRYFAYYVTVEVEGYEALKGVSLHMAKVIGSGKFHFHKVEEIQGFNYD